VLVIAVVSFDVLPLKRTLLAEAPFSARPSVHTIVRSAVVNAPFAVTTSWAFSPTEDLAAVVVAPCVRVHVVVEVASKILTFASSASFRAMIVTVSSAASAVVGVKTKVLLYGTCAVPRLETVLPLFHTMEVLRATGRSEARMIEVIFERAVDKLSF
jgi:hypothetical protein